MKKSEKFILWFSEISMKDLPLVGGKNASLGEMYRNLTKRGINIPDGFAVTATAYKFFLKKTGLEKEIRSSLRGLDISNIRDLKQRGARVRQAILNAPLPPEIERAIGKAYHRLAEKYHRSTGGLDVAVRSSATAEDLPAASFAGQLESFLNIRGEKALIGAVKKCFASLFTDRAISYRADKGFSQFFVYLSVGVQKMVRSDRASSGVAFSLDPETGFRDVVLINASYGLGEFVVKGVVNPDQYYVFETTLKKGFQPIIGRQLGAKEKKLVYSRNKSKPTQAVSVSQKERDSYVLTEKEILTLANWICQIEDYYKQPMDVEWAKDGLDNQIYIVQARPETVHTQREPAVLKEYILKKKSSVLITGRSIGEKIGQGPVRVIRRVKEIDQFRKGEVLVTQATNPDWEPIMKIAGAIVTDRGGTTSHAAIVSRELGIPCVVGTGRGTQVLKQGRPVTVSCAEGEIGKVYQGLLPFKIKKTNLRGFKKPKTRVMMNIGDPQQALIFSSIPNDGVGLAREEFIISNYIKIHPLALINYQKLNKKTKSQIDRLTAGTKGKSQFFVDKLAEGVGQIAAAFYPKEVIVRTSDFKTSEYANLIGGKNFEPKEPNPMIGWRGASRYYDPKFKEAFILECQAIKKVREVFGLKNVKVMIPFCRTVEEGKEVLKVMDRAGLKRGQDGLEVYVMAEIPSNIILAKEFAQIFDGFSIGSNDLTQLTLGVDRDSELVSHIFDERNQSVKDLVAQLIKVAHQNKRKVGICGQAPSDWAEFARFLVECGIDSISLNPDTVLKTTLDIVKTEKRLKRR